MHKSISIDKMVESQKLNSFSKFGFHLKDLKATGMEVKDDSESSEPDNIISGIVSGVPKNLLNSLSKLPRKLSSNI